MSNIFSGGSHDLDLSNGATAVFIDVLMPTVSDLASEDWDFRFAALLTLQDQNVMGRGAVGFDLAEFAWGATERGRARAVGSISNRTRRTARLVCRQGSDLVLWPGRGPLACLPADGMGRPGPARKVRPGRRRQVSRPAGRAGEPWVEFLCALMGGEEVSGEEGGHVAESEFGLYSLTRGVRVVPSRSGALPGEAPGRPGGRPPPGRRAGRR
ncbi:hypothetical protein [Streptomyces cellulosae]|uniref:Uncharacterized protein n=1 Tax=Streptomyces cellulosae TaxID=1968 RepID=A0ABW7YLP1_STRCE